MQLVVVPSGVVQVKPPGAEVAVYPETVEPPLEAGAVHDTTDWVLALEVAVTAVGAPGVPTTIELEAAEPAPTPAEVVAATVNV